MIVDEIKKIKQNDNISSNIPGKRKTAIVNIAGITEKRRCLETHRFCMRQKRQKKSKKNRFFTERYGMKS